MKRPMIIALTLAASFAAMAHGGHQGAAPMYPGSTYHHGINNDVYNHDEEQHGVEIEPDLLYIDLNGNNRVDPEEVIAENLRIQDEEKEAGPKKKQDLAARNPITWKTLNLQRGQLALTIDDGPNPRVTLPILDLLDQYGIKATFFVVGSLAERYPEVIREMVKRGHTVGNHTYSHDVPHITSETIVAEITRAHQALTKALGHAPTGRLLFRAPGLAWNEPKMIAFNADGFVRHVIAPIHANIGTDAPRADWSCWSKGVSAQTCASWYYEDIMTFAKGIVLSHDVFYRAGAGNTYELLKILLGRLDKEGGGIKRNGTGAGFWEFVTMQTNSGLDQYDLDKINQAGPQTTPAVPVQPSADVRKTYTSFSNNGANVRTVALEKAASLDSSTLISLAPKVVLKAGQLLQVTEVGPQLIVAGVTYKKVRIDKAQAGLQQFEGQVVYIWADAF